MCSFLIKECRLSLFIDAIYDMLTDGRVIPGEPTGTGSGCPLKPGKTAGCLPYNGRSGNWNHYVWDGQRVLSRVQIFLPNFSTMVSSMDRSSGCASRESGTTHIALETVVSFQREWSQLSVLSV